VRGFELHQPRSLSEAVELLAEHGTRARPLGGGTDLVAGMMRDQIIGPGLPYPAHLVDITGLPELSRISVDGRGALIGAATTLTTIAESTELGDSWPMLTAAAGEVASPEIRSIGTLGGNLNQRPRCWFFRNRDFDCAKKGGDICYAVKGDNRYNAVLEGHLCYIVHPSDLATAMLALEAEAHVVSPRGERTIAFDDYFIGPDQDLLRENVLAPDELLTEVFVPTPTAGTRQAWQKINEKGAPTWDFALASVAVAVVADDGVWRSGRVVLGGVAPVPYRATVVEQALAGRDIRSALPEAVAALRKVAKPMRHNGYKVDLVAYLLERVFATLIDSQSLGAPAGSRGELSQTLPA
jgi:xanthine dehydrogenase YagS FAD-binding subunit